MGLMTNGMSVRTHAVSGLSSRIMRLARPLVMGLVILRRHALTPPSPASKAASIWKASAVASMPLGSPEKPKETVPMKPFRGTATRAKYPMVVSGGWRFASTNRLATEGLAD